MKPINEITKNRSTYRFWPHRNSVQSFHFVHSLDSCDWAEWEHREFSASTSLSLMSTIEATTLLHACARLDALLSMILLFSSLSLSFFLDFAFVLFLFSLLNSKWFSKCVFIASSLLCGKVLRNAYTTELCSLATVSHPPPAWFIGIRYNTNTLTFSNSNRSFRVVVIPPSLSMFSSICNSSVFRIIRLRSCSRRKSYFDLWTFAVFSLHYGGDRGAKQVEKKKKINENTLFWYSMELTLLMNAVRKAKRIVYGLCAEMEKLLKKILQNFVHNLKWIFC